MTIEGLNVELIAAARPVGGISVDGRGDAHLLAFGRESVRVEIIDADALGRQSVPRGDVEGEERRHAGRAAVTHIVAAHLPVIVRQALRIRL